MKQINAKGFTLIEVMIVVLIMAIVTTVAMMSLPLSDHSRQTKIDALELLQILKLAEQHALLQTTVLGLRMTGSGFQFYQYVMNDQNQGHWVPLAHDQLSEPHRFNHGITLKAKRLPANGFITFSASGDVSPFSLLISDQSHHHCYEIDGVENGTLSLKSITP